MTQSAPIAPPVVAPGDGANQDIVVVGASAGGVDALKAVIAGLPPDYPGAVFVVLHIPPSVPSVLTAILRRVARIRCVAAGDGDAIEAGTVYVAPPNFHLLLEPGRIRLVPGPRENGHRPAVDPLFRSAAAAYGSRVAGVVLTGNLDDGTRGLLTIVAAGGVAIVQDPADADFPGMPMSAIANVPDAHVLPSGEISALLVTLAPPLARNLGGPRDLDDSSPSHSFSAPDEPRMPDQLPPALPGPGALPGSVPHHPDARETGGPQLEAHRKDGHHTDGRHTDGHHTDGHRKDGHLAGANGHGDAAGRRSTTSASDPITQPSAERAADLLTGIGTVNGGARINESLGGVVSAFTCPECHGALWELRDGALVRFRCRVGHSYTDQGLVDNKARAVEEALWTALTALEESAAIALRVSERAESQGRPQSAETFRERAEFLERRGAVLRDVLNELPGHVDAN